MNDRFLPRTSPADDASDPISRSSPHTAAATVPAGGACGTGAAAVPAYLSETYTWAYLSDLGTKVFDKHLIVQAILWGNADRLIDSVVAELKPGWRVLQPACVYGDFSLRLARALGPTGRLDVRDIAPIQVALTRRKLAGVAQATVDQEDAAAPGKGPYDAVACFFLLHEVPEEYKRAIVNNMLDAVGPDGTVIFVDYHRPRAAHPLKPVMSLVFDRLEPFAKALWDREIMDYADHPEAWTWKKTTVFGGMYQKVIARRRT
ncbi:rhodoquinone biosynthesis methyltransferase RquA [Caenispirillum salinarum]|uniref:rhodoquinone biosynthesis methyltransferase RquA n=1 Tax=Caenispirillum salinarum TaxID=859058 RepID=UPI00384F2631